jgi:hypothetical protein
MIGRYLLKPRKLAMPVELAIELTLGRYHCDWRMPAGEVSDSVKLGLEITSR